MTFELGSVFMLIWMTKDIKRSLSLINKNATAKLEILQQFKQTIQFYYDAKQLSGWFHIKKISSQFWLNVIHLLIICF